MIDVAEHREEILERWIDRVVSSYPEETGKFLRSNSDPFANPVGAGLQEGLAELLDGVIEGVDPAELAPALDRLIRVRAVQEFSPSQAVGFIFELKNLFREVAGTSGGERSQHPFDASIERLGLLAFDVYAKCREEMWRIRAREIRNQAVGIMERVAAWKERREENSEKVPQS